MKTPYAELSFLALALAVAVPAQAVDPQTAEAVLAILKQVPEPTRGSTDFEKWSYDTMGFTAIACWRSAHPTGPAPAIFNRGMSRSGTFSGPDDDKLERLCTSLATNGYEPWCVSASVQGDRKSPDPALPRDYLQFERYTEQPAVSGGLYCHLTKDIVQQQFFVPDRISARWTSAPQAQRFNLQKGEQVLKSATVMLEVPSVRGTGGGRFAQPVTGVVPN